MYCVLMGFLIQVPMWSFHEVILSNKNTVPEKIASSKYEELVLDCDSDEVVLGIWCCVCSVLA